MGTDRLSPEHGVAIRTRRLTKCYGSLRALDGLDLEVSSGTIVGYLGPNGAGKTTTLRMLVGLLQPTSGSATVLGLDVVAERTSVQAGVGYLPGDFTAPPRVTAHEYLTYLAGLRRTVVWEEVELLAKRLDLDLGRRIGELSHGNRQKVGLVQAFMHQPDVLILDEPTSGLDPLVQQEFLRMVREVRDAGRTVLLSSHVLSEVDAVADTVAILRGGRLVAVEDVAALHAKALRHLVLTFDGPPPTAALAALSGVRELTVEDRTARLVAEGSMMELWRVAAAAGVRDVVSHEADLEQVFLTHYTEQDVAPQEVRS